MDLINCTDSNVLYAKTLYSLHVLVSNRRGGRLKEGWEDKVTE